MLVGQETKEKLWPALLCSEHIREKKLFLAIGNSLGRLVLIVMVGNNVTINRAGLCESGCNSRNWYFATNPSLVQSELI